MKKNFVAFLKGIGIGASMLIPGLSGGTTAIVLGIYHQILHAFTHLFTSRKLFASRFLFLFACLLGGLCGMYLLASPVFFLFSTFKIPVTAVFVFLILMGIPVLMREAGVFKINEVKLSDIAYSLIGSLCALAFIITPLLTTPLLLADSPFSAFEPVKYILSGLIIAIALILPGISASHILLLLGIYPAVLNAITEFNVSILVILAISICIGAVLSAKLLEHLLNCYARQTNFVIIGFVLGSCVQIFLQLF